MELALSVDAATFTATVYYVGHLSFQGQQLTSKHIKKHSNYQCYKCVIRDTWIRFSDLRRQRDQSINEQTNHIEFPVFCQNLAIMAWFFQKSDYLDMRVNFTLRY